MAAAGSPHTAGIQADGDDTGVLASGENTGVKGTALGSTGTNYGLHGSTSSTSGRGVFGVNDATTGVTYGMRAEAYSTSGRAIYAAAAASTGTTFGVRGAALSTSGTGVRGEALATSGTNAGIEGRTWSPSGWGVISYGSTGSTGQKSFIQPHPSDPTKEIRYVCLEGNESGTYFRGSSQLVGGVAVIEVPEDFEMVTQLQGLTVQLTAVGAPASLWVESQDLDQIVVRGQPDVSFHYFVNGVRLGFGGHQPIQENRTFVPEFRDVPYASELPQELRDIMVQTGILNPDYTPNETFAAAMGWPLTEIE